MIHTFIDITVITSSLALIYTIWNMLFRLKTHINKLTLDHFEIQMLLSDIESMIKENKRKIEQIELSKKEH